MKLTYRLILPLIILLLSVSLTLAQEPVSTLDSLSVAFWPDYDDPSVLVLMTGTVPPDAEFPVEVTIPLPSLAEVNAVATVSEEGMADTQYQVDGDSLTLLATDPSFRVEYYVPYNEEGDTHTFDFVWNADIDIQEFIAEIQQPLNANSLTSQPTAVNVVTNPSDGLTYHAMPSRVLPAGTPFEMSFRYDMANPELTAGGPAQQPVPSAVSSNTITTEGIDWLLVLAGVAVLLLVVAVTWLLATRSSESGKPRRSSKSRKPRKPAPKERTAQAQFCHNCGTQAEKGDVFCRKCGTALKHS